MKIFVIWPTELLESKMGRLFLMRKTIIRFRWRILKYEKVK